MIAKVTVMNKILEQALLYDFYGELLTPHQKEIYEKFVLEDLSLSALEGYEARLHLVERFLSIKEKVSQIDGILEEWERGEEDPKKIAGKIRKISDAIIEEL